MPDQNLGCFELAFEELGGGHQVGHVGREIGVREVALALTQPGKIKAQHGDARVGHGAADVGHGFVVLAARKTVSEQGVGAWLPVIRGVKPCRETGPCPVFEEELLKSHVHLTDWLNLDLAGYPNQPGRRRSGISNEAGPPGSRLARNRRRPDPIRRLPPSRRASA